MLLDPIDLSEEVIDNSLIKFNIKNSKLINTVDLEYFNDILKSYCDISKTLIIGYYRSYSHDYCGFCVMFNFEFSPKYFNGRLNQENFSHVMDLYQQKYGHYPENIFLFVSHHFYEKVYGYPTKIRQTIQNVLLNLSLKISLVIILVEKKPLDFFFQFSSIDIKGDEESTTNENGLYGTIIRQNELISDEIKEFYIFSDNSNQVNSFYS